MISLTEALIEAFPPLGVNHVESISRQCSGIFAYLKPVDSPYRLEQIRRFIWVICNSVYQLHDLWSVMCPPACKNATDWGCHG